MVVLGQGREEEWVFKGAGEGGENSWFLPEARIFRFGLEGE